MASTFNESDLRLLRERKWLEIITETGKPEVSFRKDK